MYRQPREGVLNIKRKFHAGVWVPSTASTAGFWRTLTLNLTQVPNYTEITALFDQYRINAIKYTLIANFSAVDANYPGGVNVPSWPMKPSVHICYDKYTSVAPSGTYTQTNFNSFIEQGKVKTVRDPFKPINIYITKPTIYAWSAATGSSSDLKVAPFMNTVNFAGVNHYGPQVFISDPNFSGSSFPAYSWDIYVTVYMQCKNQK